MTDKNNSTFDLAAFLTHAGLGRRIVELEPKQTFFTQGDPADSVFYLQNGRARLTVVAQNGKEATITLLSAGDFVGEESLASVPGIRLATATAVNICRALKIGRDEMIRVMHEEHAFSDMFFSFLLARSMRTQADLVDQLVQLQRKAFGANSLVDGGIWQAGGTGNLHSSHYAGSPGGDDRHHTIPRQLLYEPFPQARLYRLQRPDPSAQIAAQCNPARPIARAQLSEAARRFYPAKYSRRTDREASGVSAIKQPAGRPTGRPCSSLD